MKDILGTDSFRNVSRFFCASETLFVTNLKKKKRKKKQNKGRLQYAGVRAGAQGTIYSVSFVRFCISRSPSVSLYLYIFPAVPVR